MVYGEHYSLEPYLSNNHIQKVYRTHKQDILSDSHDKNKTINSNRSML